MIKVFTLVAKLRTYAKVAEVFAMANGHKKNSVVDLLNEAADVLDELYLQLTGQWVPVDDERRPKDKQKCLLSYDFNGIAGVGVGIYSSDLYTVDEFDFCDKQGVSGWYCDDSEYGYVHNDHVTAWKPLPEPYKEEEWLPVPYKEEA